MEWNRNVRWIKLNPVQGQRQKSELLVELTLGDSVPVQDCLSLGYQWHGTLLLL
jgi:hypothetical protein